MDNNVEVSALPSSPQNPEMTSASGNPIRHYRKHLKLLLLLVFFIILAAFAFVLNQFKNVHKLHNTGQIFQLTESSPADQDGTFSTTGQPTFVFSKNIGISERDLGKYFQISPNVSGTWHLEKNGQVVYFSSDKSQSGGFPNILSFNRVYTVTIN